MLSLPLAYVVDVALLLLCFCCIVGLFSVLFAVLIIQERSKQDEPCIDVPVLRRVALVVDLSRQQTEQLSSDASFQCLTRANRGWVGRGAARRRRCVMLGVGNTSLLSSSNSSIEL